MTAHRTPIQKADDALQAYNVLRDEITPAAFREVFDLLGQLPKPTVEGGVEAFNQYVTALSASLGIARMVAGNDRTAMIAAAMLTQSGVSRPVLETGEGGD